jgi:phospholipid/cholesterol/gamma-HCH transport system substrate-binding protein
MSRNVIETVMGAVVLVIAAVFLFFAYSTSQVRSVNGYPLTARFDRIEGIREGGDVRISGIKVGTITSERLDPKTFMAVVKMSIDPTITLSTDTVAEILSSGLLGDKYLALVPGNLDTTIKPGGEIAYTQSPVSLEDLIGKYIFSAGGAAKKDGDGAAAAPTLNPPPGAAPKGSQGEPAKQ